MNLLVSLKYLVALDDHRHFGRAALASHITQPALSNAIRALEENFGTPIVKRGRNFAGFTEEGERILLSARRMLREHALLQEDLNSREGDPRGPLVIGAVPTAMPIAARFASMLRFRCPGIVPTLRSMSSVEIETGLDSLALDMGLGYTERLHAARSPLRVVPQYIERYFLLRRRAVWANGSDAGLLHIGQPLGWAEAATRPLCLLSSEMHNRTIIDRAFEQANAAPVEAAIESNSILPLALSVKAEGSGTCSVLPGALLDAVLGYGDLEALPLVDPLVEVPISFMVNDALRPSRTMEAALALAQDEHWLQLASRHSNPLGLAQEGAPLLR